MNRKKYLSNRSMQILLLAAILLLAIFPLRFIVNYLSFPYPFEYRDAAPLVAAVDFSKGVNPYRIYNFPGHLYLYGFLYPAMMVPFIYLTSHPMIAARIVDVLSLLFFLGISFWILRKRNASIISSLMGVLILMNAFCRVWVINGSRPDAAGTFFAFLGFSFLLMKDKGNRNLTLCAIACVVSFYLKQYLVFSAVVVALSLFLFVSKQKGFLFMVETTMLVLASYLLVRSVLPLYFEFTILQSPAISVTSLNTAQMINQSVDFLKSNWILCLVYLIYLGISLRSFGTLQFKDVRLKFSDQKTPFLQGISADLFDVGFFASSLLLTFYFGRVMGNYYTYYGELLLPFLVFAAIPKMDEIFKVPLQLSFVQGLILVFCIFPFRLYYERDFRSYREAYTELYRYADQCTAIFDETPLIAVYKLEHGLYPIYNNGHVEYAYSVIPSDETILSIFSTQPAESFNKHMLEWGEDIRRDFNNGKFDCIITDRSYKIENYTLKAEIDQVLGYTVYVWVLNQP